MWKIPERDFSKPLPACRLRRFRDSNFGPRGYVIRIPIPVVLTREVWHDPVSDTQFFGWRMWNICVKLLHDGNFHGVLLASALVPVGPQTEFTEE